MVRAIFPYKRWRLEVKIMEQKMFLERGRRASVLIITHIPTEGSCERVLSSSPFLARPVLTTLHVAITFGSPLSITVFLKDFIPLLRCIV